MPANQDPQWDGPDSAVRPVERGGCGFGFATCISALHFAATFASTRATRRGQGLTTAAKGKLSLAELWSYVLLYNISLVSTTLSLANNPIAIYQIAKLLGGPFIATAEWLTMGTTLSMGQMGAIVAVLSGVGLVVVSPGSATASRGPDVTAPGLMMALVAVVSSGLQQLGCRWIQSERGISSMDLLEMVSLPMAVSLAATG